MFKINENYKNLNESYLFTEIAHRVAAFTEAHPEKKIIKMGIGDVTRPLVPAVTDALKKASDEMGAAETFRGYGPEQGYDFLREKIQKYYAAIGAELELGEIFISDGAKSDVGNITDLFSPDNIVAVPDPVYPVYVDTNIMNGRKIVYFEANEANGFLPMPEDIREGSLAEGENIDIVYMCSPNNPTGAVYSRAQLKTWVDWAMANGAVILFDSAYEFFVTDNGDASWEEGLPRSIFEIPGAKECAIEFCSLSKTAGFTGTRCGYTVVPYGLGALNKMWVRRQTTKFNGTSYIIQRGAEAVFTEEGQRQVRENIDYYRQNARIITAAFDELGIWYTGGKNSPYIWMKCPNGMSSWEFFDFLLENAGVVGTPGAGFGANGEGFFRLTAFSTNELTKEAMERFKSIL